MPRLALPLAIVALGLAAWLALEGSGVRRDLEVAQGETATLRSEVARLERSLAAALGEEPPPAQRCEPAALAGTAPAAAPEAGPELVPLGASPEVLARTIRDLQRQVATQGERVAQVEEKIQKDPAQGWQPPRFFSTVDEATEGLKLDARQRADMERTVEYARRDIEDLHNLPNEEGKTWKEVSSLQTTAASGEGFSIVMTNLAELSKFQASKVPGTNETYAEAENRIRERAKRDIRSTLNPEQQKTWDESITDPLLGSDGAGAFVSFGAAIDVTPTPDPSSDR